MKKFVATLFLMFILVSAYQVQAATSSTTPAKTSDNSGYESIKNIGKTIGEKMPNFITKGVVSLIDLLEEFRTNTFNRKIIFYPILIVALYFISRFIWNWFFP